MNVNNDKKTLVEILENYALGKNTLKWIPEGGEILKSINNEGKEKSIVMVSHRKSSVSICDKKVYVKNNTLNLA